MTDQLPPFGIRRLSSSESLFSVLQISEQQYDNSIDACPNAALTWIDDDDGEVITVGSGNELRERLNDPASIDAPLISFSSATSHAREDRYIHLFDISRSRESKELWRAHRASWRTSQSPSRHNAEQQSVVDVGEEISEKATSLISRSTVSVHSSDDYNDHQSSTVQQQQDVDAIRDAKKELVVAFEATLDSLASFLQATSNTIRRAAEKTRETDTSPIEDVLSGMTTILGEIGTFGLDVLDIVDVKLTKAADDIAPIEELTEEPCHSSSELTLQEPLADGVTELFSAQNKKGITHQGNVVKQDSHTESSNIEKKKEETQQSVQQFGADKSWSGSVNDAKSECPQLGQPAASLDPDMQALHHESRPTLKNSDAVSQSVFDDNMFDLKPFSPFVMDDIWYPTPPSGPPRTSCNASVQDVQAMTAGIVTQMQNYQKSLLDRDEDEEDFSIRYPPLMNLHRANTTGNLQTRSSDSRNVATEGQLAQGQSYPSRPSPQVFDAETKRRKDFARTCFPDQQYTPGLGSLKGSQSVRLPRGAKPSFATVVKVQAIDMVNGSQASFDAQALETLPGLVPTASEDPSDRVSEMDQSALKVISEVKTLPGAWPQSHDGNVQFTVPEQESSGAFFNRMISQSRAPADNASDNPFVKAADLARHRSSIHNKRPLKSTGDLHRAHTVSAANPAARLNRPFNPFVSEPGTTQHMEEAPAMPQKSPGPGPVRSINRNSTDRRPWSLYEPYRPFSSTRPFSPVWEDHLQPTDLRKNVDARLPLRSTASQTPLKADTSIMHQETSRELPPSGPRRMRSVPTFAREANSKPSFRDFVSRPRGHPTPALTIVTQPNDANGMSPLPTTQNVVPNGTEGQSLTLAVDACEQSLREMGYGLSDPTLLARLHVYAAAAEGDVMEAVELIEDDKLAHLEEKKRRAEGESEEEELKRVLKESWDAEVGYASR